MIVEARPTMPAACTIEIRRALSLLSFTNIFDKEIMQLHNPETNLIQPLVNVLNSAIVTATASDSTLPYLIIPDCNPKSGADLCLAASEIVDKLSTTITHAEFSEQFFIYRISAASGLCFRRGESFWRSFFEQISSQIPFKIPSEEVTKDNLTASATAIGRILNTHSELVNKLKTDQTLSLADRQTRHSLECVPDCELVLSGVFARLASSRFVPSNLSVFRNGYTSGNWVDTAYTVPAIENLVKALSHLGPEGTQIAVGDYSDIALLIHQQQVCNVVVFDNDAAHDRFSVMKFASHSLDAVSQCSMFLLRTTPGSVASATDQLVEAGAHYDVAVPKFFCRQFPKFVSTLEFISVESLRLPTRSALQVIDFAYLVGRLI
jgi:hypothetical protein